MIKTELSILIPTYNDVCIDLVRGLAKQCMAVKRLRYHILVADDGSTDPAVIEANQAINGILNCSYVLRGVNCGRAITRNWLAYQARHEWLLFIDADMSLERDDFIQRYVEEDEEGGLLYGGYVVKGDEREWKGNLRFRYEKKEEPKHTMEQREEHPYQDFHTSNFLIMRRHYVENLLDARFKHYGYEDVLFGKVLQQKFIPIIHIDNPVAFSRFEDNEHFVAKMEEGMRTLYEFRDELSGYSRLIDKKEKLERHHLLPVVRHIFNICKRHWRANLCGNNPSLFVFKLYKIGYYCSLHQRQDSGKQEQ